MKRSPWSPTFMVIGSLLIYNIVYQLFLLFKNLKYSYLRFNFIVTDRSKKIVFYPFSIFNECLSPSLLHIAVHDVNHWIVLRFTEIRAGTNLKTI